MATKTFEELKQMAIQIRDEKTNKQNTATRIGTQMLEHLNKLEQEYYDKITLDKRVTELNISELYKTQGIGGTNKYDLATAIAQVPTQYRNIQGLKITFVNNETDKPECWVYNGGTFTTTTNWVLSNDSEKIKDLENECLGEIKTLKTLIKPLTGNVTEKIYSKDSNMIQGYWNQNIFQSTNSAWKSSSSTVNISTENLIGFYVIGNYTDEDKIQFYGLDKQFTHLVLLKDIVSQSLQDYLRDTDKYFNISIKTPYDIVITALYSDNYIDVSKFSENIESLNLQIEKIEENIGQHTLSIEELTIIIDVIQSIIGNIEIIKYTKDVNTVQGYWNQNIFQGTNSAWKSSSSIVELSTDNLINFTFEGEESIEDKIDFYNKDKQWTHSELVQNIKTKNLSEYIRDTDKYYNVGIRQPFNLTVNAVFLDTGGIFDLNKINEAFKKAENAETKSNEAITKSNTLSEDIIPKYYLKTVLVNGKMSFEGKKGAFIGDSIMAGVRAQDLRGWVFMFQDLHKMQDGLKFALGGMGYMKADAGEHTMVTRLRELIARSDKDTCDYLFMGAGINDVNYQNTLGSFGDKTEETFYGAVEVCCKLIEENLPNITPIFITPIYSYLYEKFKNRTADPYRRAIYEVATSHGFSVVNGLDISDIRFSGDEIPYIRKITDDDLHPITLGHKLYCGRLSEIIARM